MEIIAFDQISFVFLEADGRYLRTSDGKTYYVNESLEELENLLDSSSFFRANRQIIIGRTSISNYQPIEFGKLLVETLPAIPGGVVVSQRKAKDFRSWFAN